MHSNDSSPSSAEQVDLEARGAGEWIARPPGDGAALHIYELAATDWLVSEVGQTSEGRGSDVRSALAALARGRSAPAWWQGVVETLDGNGGAQARVLVQPSAGEPVGDDSRSGRAGEQVIVAHQHPV
ncbi:MAG TPA: hypothetical protein VLZ06_06030 [Solirubrobacteraceae bacterium]|nr:hypothetical protein [Solirubrobacteraceae bacterium]